MPGPARTPSLALVTLFVSLLPFEAPASGDPTSPDSTLAPYFLVQGGDPAVDRFPLAETDVEVAISGPVAAVRVTQTWANEGERPIHARYVFPASTRAAVNGLRMALDGRVIEAEIQERRQAERTFAAAKQEGRTASLLQQERPNVFTMDVANVMPGDQIEVTLRYTELLVPRDGRYEFVFPTVVGPRYVDGGGSGAPARAPDAPSAAGPVVALDAAEAVGSNRPFTATPHLHSGEAPPSPLHLYGTVAAGLPIHEIASPTHSLDARFDDQGVWHFASDEENARGAGDRDFVLGFRLAGDAVETGLSLFEAGDEKYFLLLAMPPARVEPSTIPPREFVFILDVSGSMQGFPIGTAKVLMRELLGPLRPRDRFNVLAFSGGSRLLSPTSLPATPAEIDAALAALDGFEGGGGTELLPALERALALSPEPGLARTFIVITDGYVAADDRALDFVRDHLAEANVFAFGIGSSVNRHLIEGLARTGQGEPFVVLHPSEANDAATRFTRYVATPVLTDVRVEVAGFDAYDLEPRVLPDVLAERPVVLMGKWRGEPAGEIVVRGVTGTGAWSQRIRVEDAPPLAEHRALPILWARARIDALTRTGFAEPDAEARAEILALGLHHRLLTRFTSFVAVSKIVRNRHEPGVDVDQPLPMPAGVSDAAVGVGAEPGLLGLAIAVLLALGMRAALRGRAREPMHSMDRAA
ncbi:MAG: VWA domain-containing protein [Myxococcales bacterium]|nr:VWA domain-containing protein [Myxococcales bacterium]